MAAPKVSVLVTCFNIGWALDEALDSVFAQTFRDFEVLLVDDGSTDPATRAKVAALDPSRVKVFHTEHRGVCAARNLLLREARGEYVVNFDGDDVLMPEFLEAAVEVLDAEPAIAFVSSWVEIFGEAQWTWRKERCDLAALLAECTVNGPSPVRREAVLGVGGYDEAMIQRDEDLDLWIRLVRKGYAGTILPRVLYRYRWHGRSATSNTSAEQRVRVVREMAEKYPDSLREHLEEVILSRQRRNAETRARTLDAVAPAHPPVPAPARYDYPALSGYITELAKARGEVEALRKSLSWKITGPLRAALGLLRSGRGRG